MGEEANDIPQVDFNDDFIRSRLKGGEQNELVKLVFDFNPKSGRILSVGPFNYYKNITELSLIGHGLSNIDNLKNLTKLIRLNLSYNKIKSIKPLLDIKSLEVLSLSYNQIDSIPKSISKLSNLQSLRLNGNPIHVLKDMVYIKPLINLKNLDIERTDISRNQDSLLYIIFILPHINILNRNYVSIEDRRRAAERFTRSEIEELQIENDDLYQQVESLTQENNDLKKQLSRQSRTNAIDSDLMEQINQLKEELESQKAVNNQLTSDLAKERTEVARLMTENGIKTPTKKVDLSEFQKLKEEIEDLKNELRDNKQQNTQNEITIREMKDRAERAEDERQTMGEELDKLREEFDKKDRKLTKKQAEITQLLKEKSNLEEINRAQQEGLTELQRTQTTLMDRSSILKSATIDGEHVSSAEAIRRMNNLNSRVRDLEKELADMQKKLFMAEKELSEKTIMIDQINGELTKRNNQITQLEEELTHTNHSFTGRFDPDNTSLSMQSLLGTDIQEQVTELARERTTQLETRLALKDSEIKRLESENTSLKNEKQEYEKETLNLRSELDKAKAWQEIIPDKDDAIAQLKSRLDATRKEIADLQEKFGVKSKHAKELRKLVRKQSSEIDTLKKKQAEYEKMGILKDDYDTKISEITKFKDIIEQESQQTELIETLKKQLNQNKKQNDELKEELIRISHSQESAEVIKNSLQAQIAEKEQQVIEMQKEVKKLRREIGIKDTTIAQYETELRDFQTRSLNQDDAIHDTIREQTETIFDLKTTITRLEERAAAAEDDAVIQLNHYFKRLATLPSVPKFVNGENYEAAIRSVKEYVNDKDTQLKKLAQDMKILERKIKQIAQMFLENTGKLEPREMLDKIGGHIAKLQQQIKDVYQEHEDQVNEISRSHNIVQKQKADLEQLALQLQDDLKNANEVIRNYEDKFTHSTRSDQSKNEHISKMKRALKKAEKTVNEYQKLLADASATKDNLESIKELNKTLQQSLTEKQETIEKLNGQVKRANSSSKKIDEFEKKVKAISKRLAIAADENQRLRAAIQELEGNCQNKDSQIDFYRSKLEEERNEFARSQSALEEEHSKQVGILKNKLAKTEHLYENAKSKESFFDSEIESRTQVITALQQKIIDLRRKILPIEATKLSSTSVDQLVSDLDSIQNLIQVKEKQLDDAKSEIVRMSTRKAQADSALIRSLGLLAIEPGKEHQYDSSVETVKLAEEVERKIQSLQNSSESLKGGVLSVLNSASVNTKGLKTSNDIIDALRSLISQRKDNDKEFEGKVTELEQTLETREHEYDTLRKQISDQEKARVQLENELDSIYAQNDETVNALNSEKKKVQRAKKMLAEQVALTKEYEDTIKQLGNQLNEMQNENVQLNQHIMNNENAIDDLNHIRASLEERVSMLETRLNETSNERTMLMAQMEDTSATMQSETGKQKREIVRLTRLLDEKSKIELELNEERSNISRELKQTQRELNANKKVAADLQEENGSLSEQVSKQEAEIKDLKLKVKELERTVAAMKDEQDGFDDTIKRNESKFANEKKRALEDIKREHQAELDEKERQINDNIRKNKENEKKTRALIKMHEQKLADMRRELKEQFALAANYKAQYEDERTMRLKEQEETTILANQQDRAIEELENQNGELKDALEKAIKARDDLNNRFEEARNTNAQIVQQLQSDLNAAKNLANSLKAEIGNKENEIARLNQNAERLGRQQSLNDESSQIIMKLHSEVAERDGKLLELNALQMRLNNTQSALKQVQQEHADSVQHQNDLNKEIAQLKATIDILEKEKKEMIQNLENEKKELSGKLESETNRASELQKLIKENENNNNVSNQKYEAKIEALEAKIKSLNDLIKRADEEHASMISTKSRAVENAESQLSSLQEQLQKREGQISILNAEISRQQQQNNSLNLERKQLKKKMDGMYSKIKDFEGQLDDMNRSIARTDIEKTQLQLQIKENELRIREEEAARIDAEDALAHALSDKERLSRQLSDLQSQSITATEILRQQQDSATLLSTITEKEQVEASLRKKINELNEKMRTQELEAAKKKFEIEDLERVRASLESQLESANEEKKNLEKQIEKLKALIAQHESTINQAMANDSANKLQKASLEGEMKALREKITEMKENESTRIKEIEAKNQKLHENEIDLEKLRIQMSNAESQAKSNIDAKDREIDAKIQTISELESTINKLKKNISEIGSELTEMKSLNNDLESEVTNLKAKINSDKENAKKLENSLSEVKSEMQRKIDEAVLEVRQKTSKINDLQQQLENAEQQRSALEVKYNQVNTNLTNALASYNDADNAAREAQHDVEMLNERLETENKQRLRAETRCANLEKALEEAQKSTNKERSALETRKMNAELALDDAKKQISLLKSEVAQYKAVEDELRMRVTGATNDGANLKQQIQKLKASEAANANCIQTQSKRIQDLQNSIAKQAEQLSESQQSLMTAETTIRQQKLQIESLKRDLETEKNEKKQIQTRQQKLIDENRDDLQTARKEVSKVTEESNKQIQELKEKISNLEAILQETEDSLELCNENERSLRQQNENLLRQLEQAQSTIAQYENQAKAIKEHVKELKTQRKVFLKKHDTETRELMERLRMQEKEAQELSMKLQFSMQQSSEQTKKIRNLEGELAYVTSRLEETQSAASQLPLDLDEYRKKYESEHNSVLELQAALNASQSTIESKGNENIRLGNQLQETKKSLSSLQSDLDKLRSDLIPRQRLEAANDKLMEKKKQIADLQKDIKEYASKYSSLHQSYVDITKAYNDVSKLVHDLHNFIASNGRSVSNLKEFIESVARLFAPIFQQFSIQTPRISFSSQFCIISRSIVASIDPTDAIQPQQARLLSTMRQELFSMTRETGIQMPSEEMSLTRLTAQLEQLRSLVLLVKGLFQTREDRIEQMGALVSSQHQAILNIMNGDSIDQNVSISADNYKHAQRILEEDRVMRTQVTRT